MGAEELQFNLGVDITNKDSGYKAKTEDFIIIQNGISRYFT